ncbi:hypothetical protein D3260_01260 [Salinisphaera sp. Q1T1-3]|nr:hypothetical protein D3260_01260 [Salinisphaera sp. Q1T1-3]
MLSLTACTADAPSAEQNTDPANADTSAAVHASAEKPTDVDTLPSGAADVIRRYYDAIDHRDYSTAYHLWGPRDGDRNASGKTLADFRQGFADTQSSRVAVGTPRQPEGAAGSIYITVPVTVIATQDSGAQKRFTGTYVLRRVNDVDGATRAQRRWHLYSADLHATGTD